VTEKAWGHKKQDKDSVIPAKTSKSLRALIQALRDGKTVMDLLHWQDFRTYKSNKGPEFDFKLNGMEHIYSKWKLHL